jgi:hypothetical protein
MPEKDFFACSPAPFYNCRVLKTNEIVGAWTAQVVFLLR